MVGDTLILMWSQPSGDINGVKFNECWWSRAPETLLSFPPVINGGTLSCLLGTLIIPFFLDSTCFLWLPFGDVSITLLLLF